MKKSLLLFFLTLLLFGCQEPTLSNVKLEQAEPTSVGFNADFEQYLDEYVSQALTDTIIPHGTFLVAKNNKVVYFKSFGDQKPNDALQNDDIFRLASMTKAITAVSIMQLAEKGIIALDDPASKYLPAFENQLVLDEMDMSDSTYTTVRVEKNVTIRNLLTHTSGIVYGSFNPGELDALYRKNDVYEGFSLEDKSTEEWINDLARVPLAHQPGARFSYGLSMDVLGRIIEVASGKRLDQYFQENIFNPAGMTDTYFYQPDTNHDRIVPVYMKVQGQYVDGSKLGFDLFTSYPSTSGRDFFAGGSGLSGTALDYAMFMQELVQGGGSLLSEASVKEMSRDQLPDVINDYENYPKNPNEGFSLGFTVYQDKPTKKSPKSPGTYEWGGFFNTKFFIDPQEQLIFVGMTQINAFQHNDFWDGLYELIYEGLK